MKHSFKEYNTFVGVYRQQKNFAQTIQNGDKYEDMHHF